jgi:hypothetical protein
LVHEGYGPVADGGYLINLMIPLWEKMGCRVMQASALEPWPEADGAFIHVDLSVVPASYTEQAARYEYRWNSSIHDIRKRSLCTGLIQPEAVYEGPVMVKTNLNHAGIPERNRVIHQNLQRRRKWLKKFWPGWRQKHLEVEPSQLNKSHYQVFPSLDQVPPEMRYSEDWVMQTFLTEPMAEGYALHEYYFLGGAGYVRAEVGAEPCFTSGRIVSERVDSIPPELLALRRRLGLDYGKIDFIMQENRPFVFDVNKTVGFSTESAALKVASCLAWGLFPEWAAHREKSQAVVLAGE